MLALIPSGGGKSLTFQLSAMTEKGWTIAIMPLISLIEDQIYQMKELGVPWTYFKESIQYNEIMKQVISK